MLPRFASRLRPALACPGESRAGHGAPGQAPWSRRAFLAGFATLIEAPRALASPPFAWPGGARAAVSLTYDDGLNSQLDNGLPQLEAAGFKATFFLVQENMEARLADWRRVAELGHEIGDHTEDHPCQLGGFTAKRFEKTEISPMEQFLDANFGKSERRPYAYPCGFIGLGRGPASERFGRYAEVLGKTFTAARTTSGPPIDPRSAWAERLHLSGFEPTYERDDPSLAFAYLRETLRQGRWAILVFHEILPRRVGEGDTSTGAHQAILDFIKGEPLWCASLGEVLAWTARRRLA